MVLPGCNSKISSIFFSDRKKVLKHHPDKKASSTSSEFTNSLYLAGINQNTNDDAFFKCIQKAHEVLTNPEKRRQFDSVDPVFMELEEDMPTASEIKVSSNPIYLYILREFMLLTFFFGCCCRTRSWTFSLPLALSSIFTRAFPKSNLSLALVILTLARKRLKASTTFGIILIAGGASNGLIKKSTRAVTGLFSFTLDIGLC